MHGYGYIPTHPNLRHLRQRYKRAPGFGAHPAQLYPTEYPEVLIQHVLPSPARRLQSRRVRRTVPQPSPALANHG